MITQLRLDQRLIHGQVIATWSGFLGIDTILAANDAIAKDDFAKKAMMMSAPAKIRVQIRGVDESIRLLKDPRADKMKILLVCNNPKDCLKLMTELDIQDINIASYRWKKPADAEKDQKVMVIHQYCHANPEDFEVFKQIANSGKNVFQQMLPSVDRNNFAELVKNATEKK